LTGLGQTAVPIVLLSPACFRNPVNPLICLKAVPCRAVAANMSRALAVCFPLSQPLGVRKKYLYLFWLVLLAAGFVAHSLQMSAHMRLVRASPAPKIPAPSLVYLSLPNTLCLPDLSRTRRNTVHHVPGIHDEPGPICQLAVVHTRMVGGNQNAVEAADEVILPLN
jgi:hypothetical protein